jgi:Phosphodiester glycosidase
MRWSWKHEGKRSRKRRVGLVAVGATVLGLWVALHVFPGFGPAVADGARAVLGPGPVAWAEDGVYGVEDRIKRVLYRDARPKTFWEEPPAPPGGEPPELPVAASSDAGPSAFGPAPFEPPVPSVAARGDGRWIAVADARAPMGAPSLFKTLVHPDAGRSFAAVAVIALDLQRLSLHAVAGTLEPQSSSVPKSERPGLIPTEDLDLLVVGFNGGFKAEHGHYGMMVGGRTFLPPRKTSCTVALYPSGDVRIRTFDALADSVGAMSAYRQTPPCLVEEGNINDALLEADDAKGWGVSVSGQTVIRRSAVGLDATGKTLFYGVGESVTAGTLARAMKAAGAANAAQLDVNEAYPRFVFYAPAPHGVTPRVTSALIPDIHFSRSEYVGKPELRDFFYVTRKPDATAQGPT